MAATRCCIESCPTKKGDWVPLHSFPRENPAQCQAWINFVRATRGAGSAWTPLKASRLCGRHFTLECYRSNYVCTPLLMSARDVPWQLYPRWLRPDSVPTVNGGRDVRAVEPDTSHLARTKVLLHGSRQLNERLLPPKPGSEVRTTASQTVEEAPSKRRCAQSKRQAQTQCCVERYWKTTQSTLVVKTASVKTQTRCVKREQNGT